MLLDAGSASCGCTLKVTRWRMLMFTLYVHRPDILQPYGRRVSKLRLGEGPGAARESGQFHGLMEGRIVV